MEETSTSAVLSANVPRKKREVDPALAERLSEIRARARRAHDALADGIAGRTLQAIAAGEIAEGIDQLAALMTAPDPSDTIGRAAWHAAVDGESHDRTVLAVAAAQDARFQWNELATAVGIDPDDYREIQSFGRRQRRRHQEILDQP